MEQTAFNLRNADGEFLTSPQAERWLVSVITDPGGAQKYWADRGQIDYGLQVLVLRANEELREQLWDSLDDNVKFALIIYGGAAPDDDEETLVKGVVSDVVAALYHLPWEVGENG